MNLKDFQGHTRTCKNQNIKKGFLNKRKYSKPIFTNSMKQTNKLLKTVPVTKISYSKMIKKSSLKNSNLNFEK